MRRCEHDAARRPQIATSLEIVSRRVRQLAIQRFAITQTAQEKCRPRRIGTDEDMAWIAIHLASRAGDYVVGDAIAVDGGVVYANAGLEIAG
jgi:NAD(P)-dependent dehydrogenase (short-subunit alcohol dehydrogenase family)